MHHVINMTPILVHGKAKDKDSMMDELNGDLVNLNSWSGNVNLALNPIKKKIMIVSTKQISMDYGLHNYVPNINIGSNHLRRVHTSNILGVHFNANLQWDEHISQIILSCYAALSALKKLKNIKSCIKSVGCNCMEGKHSLRIITRSVNWMCILRARMLAYPNYSF